MLLNEAGPEFQPYPRLLRSPPFVLACKLKGEEQGILWEVHRGPDYEGRTWKPVLFDSHSCKDLIQNLGIMGCGFGVCYTLSVVQENQSVKASWYLSSGYEESMGFGMRVFGFKVQFLQEDFSNFVVPPHFIWVRCPFLFPQCLLFSLSSCSVVSLSPDSYLQQTELGENEDSVLSSQYSGQRTYCLRRADVQKMFWNSTQMIS